MSFEIKDGCIIGDIPANMDASAILQLESTVKGALLPRMTTAQKNAIASPANGLIVYDTATKSFWYYDLTITTWIEIGGGGGNTNWLGVLASSPLIGVAGDWYTHQTTGEAVYYDATRSKWLGLDIPMLCNRNGTVVAGNALMIGMSSMTNFGAVATPFGFQCPFALTLIGIAIRRNIAAPANTNFRIFKNNVTEIHATPLMALNVLETSETNLNLDLVVGDAIGVGVKTGIANAPVAYLTAKRKY